MKTAVHSASLLALAAALVGCSDPGTGFRRDLSYPAVPPVEGESGLHASLLDDTPSRQDWLDAQAELTEHVLGGIAEREFFRRRLRELMPPERRVPRPVVAAGRTLEWRDTELWVSAGEGERSILSLPELADGSLRIFGTAASPDGELALVGVAAPGSSTRRWMVLDTDTGEMLDGLEIHTDQRPVFLPGRRLLYTEYAYYMASEGPSRFDQIPRLYLHLIGEPQRLGEEMFARPDTEQGGSLGIRLTPDGQGVCLFLRKGLERWNDVFFTPLDSLGSDFRSLFVGTSGWFSLAGQRDGELWFRTDHLAPRGRVVAISTEGPRVVREVIPEQAFVLQELKAAGDGWLSLSLENGHARLDLLEPDGAPRFRVALPGIGHVDQIGSARDESSFTIRFSSLTRSPVELRGDVHRQDLEVAEPPEFAFAGEFETSLGFATSADGTRVPIFVAHPVGLERDGSHRTLLRAYGFGGYPIEASWRPAAQAWLEQGGVFAVAAVRGGGDLGREWHEAGMQPNRRRVYQDHRAASRWLIEQGYCTSRSLGLVGGSAGGHLVGVALTEVPELQAAGAPVNGVFDMKTFASLSGGEYWTDEFGPDEPSPLHLVEPDRCYGPVLVSVSREDFTVDPSHGYRFVAALQASARCPQPKLLLPVEGADHDSVLPDPVADRLSFLWAALGD